MHWQRCPPSRKMLFVRQQKPRFSEVLLLSPARLLESQNDADNLPKAQLCRRVQRVRRLRIELKAAALQHSERNRDHNLLRIHFLNRPAQARSELYSRAPFAPPDGSHYRIELQF